MYISQDKRDYLSEENGMLNFGVPQVIANVVIKL